MKASRIGAALTVACAVLLGAALLNATPASAATLKPCAAAPPPGPITEIDGEVTIVQSRAIRRKFNRSGIRTRLIKPANSFTGRPQFPVEAVSIRQGNISLVNLGGAIRLRGKGKRQLELKQLQVQTSSLLSIVKARFAGANRRFLLIEGEKFSTDPETGETTVTGGKARLSNAAVKVFKKRLGLSNKTLPSRAVWGTFDLYSLYKVTLPPKGPEGEAPPVPPVSVRPEGATDIATATINWRVRDTFIRYVNSGDGATAIDGAIPAGPEGSPPLVYSFGLPFTSGWTHEGTGKALVKGSGGVAFRYCRHTVNFHVTDPEIELNGADSRMIFRVNGLDGTAYPNQRAVVVDLDLTQADETTNGNTTTWENIPGFVPQGSAGVFADFYFGGDSFGELDLTVTRP